MERILRVEKKKALITGASSGIGEEYARHLASLGFDLALVARRKELLEKLAGVLKESHGRDVQVIQADLSGFEDLEKLVREISNMDDLRFLVHGAGFGTRGLLADIDEGKSTRMAFLHTVAPTRIVRAVLPKMIEGGGGAVVLVSSLGAFFTTAEYTVYSATKAFHNMFMLGLRDEVDQHDISVQALCPGLTRTGFMQTEEYRDFDYSAIPKRAWMEPEDVVRESLAKLSNRKPVVIPGGGNRVFVGIMSIPLLGRFLRFLMSYMSRRNLSKGKQSLF